MASIKVKFRPSSNKEKNGMIFYQIIHSRKVRQIRSNMKISSHEWDTKNGTILIRTCNTERKLYLQNVQRAIASEVARYKSIISTLETKGREYTVNDIVMLKGNLNGKNSFFSFMRQMIGLQAELGNYRQCEIYNTAYNSLMRYTEGRDILFSEFNSRFIMSYEAYLKERVSKNTSSFYMRNLRSVYNRAVEEGVTEQKYPFKHVYTGVEKTVKRAVSLHVIRKLKETDLSGRPDLAFARDMFLFSFYTRGMAFIDMAYLKKHDLQCGKLIYARRKTKQKLYVKWEKCMQDIVKRYSNPKSPYMLPILIRDGILERNDYRNMSCKINERLRVVSEIIGLTTPLTMYVARHTWASIAKSKNIPLSIISEGMGHDSELTTRIYLASLDTNAVDKANSLILNLL